MIEVSQYIYQNKTACYVHENRHIDQCNRIDSPKTNPCLYINNIKERRQEHTIVYPNGVGKIGHTRAKKKKGTKPHFYIIYRKKLKMD